MEPLSLHKYYYLMHGRDRLPRVPPRDDDITVAGDSELGVRIRIENTLPTLPCRAKQTCRNITITHRLKMHTTQVGIIQWHLHSLIVWLCHGFNNYDDTVVKCYVQYRQNPPASRP